MNCIFIDPYTLAYPSDYEKISINEFENYLDNILLWRQLKDVPLSNVVISKQTSDILMDHNNYPYWDSLKNALLKTGLSTFYQPRDIIGVIEGFLQQPSFDETFNLVDILVDNVAIFPNDHLERRPPMYSEEYKKIVIVLSLMNITLNKGKQSYFVTRDSIKEIMVQGEIHECEFTNDESFDLEYPIKIDDTVYSYTHLSELITNINVVKSWENATTITEYYELMNLFIKQRLISSNLDISEIPNWRFGHHFLDTCRELGFYHEESKIKTLLRSCADTILNQNLTNTHALRKDESGNSPQVTREKDKAWRRDIDYEYHLHYWQTSNGPELAAVVVHNNMDIPA
ncbi:hypothetical protein PAEVO_52420 [Paenibacillus sp. GM2FR]|uniref:hypothetical protein n=1 Tax=Paenibacillus sp. GM2FR TaxID=2059268 RepID=UPI000C27C87F|nr:hypothetical protein [Paenibacillus sp. GM2FR]PJN50198.1 hypothetical protein PAEVO_52420 [Paenibacillus sp. GM2FR]